MFDATFAWKKTVLFFFLSVLFLSALPGVENPPLSLSISIDKKDGVYPKGGNVILSVQLKKEGKLFAGQKMGYYCYSNNVAKEKKFVPFTSNGKVQKFAIPIPHEYLIIDVLALDKDGKVYTCKKGKRSIQVKRSIGVVAAPEKITTGIPEPADFRQFWEKNLKELAALPLKYTMKEVEVPARYKGKFKCYNVEAAFLAGFRPVRAYMSIPIVKDKNKKFPAIVHFHSAGVRASVKRFTPNFITLDVNAHGVENGKSARFYKDFIKNEMKSYLYKGYTKRDSCVFRSVFLRMKRALDFVKKLPMYDGKTLITTGGSQGGALAIIAAALDKDVTLVHATVPALGDQGGALVPGRKAGWPYYIGVKNGKVTNKNIAGSVIYYDTAYFAKRVKAKVIMTIGLADNICVTPSVFSIYNNLPAKNKSLVIHPSCGHGTPPAPEFTAIMKKLSSGR